MLEPNMSKTVGFRNKVRSLDRNHLDIGRGYGRWVHPSGQRSKEPLSSTLGMHVPVGHWPAALVTQNSAAATVYKLQNAKGPACFTVFTVLAWFCCSQAISFKAGWRPHWLQHPVHCGGDNPLMKSKSWLSLLLPHLRGKFQLLGTWREISPVDQF